MKTKASELRKEIEESIEILDQTTDPKERKVIEKGISDMKKELQELESEIEKKPVTKKKVTVKPKEKKITKKKLSSKKVVKISEIIPEKDKKNVRDILEKEYYQVIIKEIDGKKVKVSVKHSDKTVAKNKIESAFVTISKKVNSKEEKKEYSEELKVLSEIEKSMKKLVESIYSAFNAKKIDELKKILTMIKTQKFEEGGVIEKPEIMKVTNLTVKLESETSGQRFIGEKAKAEIAKEIYDSYNRELNETYHYYIDNDIELDERYADEYIMDQLLKKGYSRTYTHKNDIGLWKVETITTPKGVLIINKNEIVKQWDVNDMGTPLPQAIVKCLLIEFE